MPTTKNFYRIIKLADDVVVYLVLNEQGYKQAVTDFSDHLKPAGIEYSFPCVLTLSFDFDNFVDLSPTVKKIDAQPFIQRFLGSSVMMNRTQPFTIEELLNNYSSPN